MLYLLDANISITANSTYYPIGQVPEFWDWLQYQGERGNVKIPLEIMEEILQGRDEDPLVEWIKKPEVQAALLSGEAVDAALVQRAVEAYAPDLTDDELDVIGRDPFLIAYALVAPGNRCVVTTEVSKPTATRKNRKVPDVCRDLGVQSCGPFQLNRDLGFSTRWRP
jgi:hypothetical protein